MALTKITSAGISDDAVTTDKLANAINAEREANTAKTTNATHSGEVTGATALTIADNVVDEANLKVSNSPTNGYFLSAQSGNTGGLTWAQVITDLVGDTSPQLGGDLQSNGHDIDFADNDKAIFGTGNDLEIYHNGSHNFINITNGQLRIRHGTDNAIKTIADGAVQLYYDGSNRLLTTTGGIEIIGETVASSHIKLADNARLKLGTGEDFQIYHDGSHNIINGASGQNLEIQTNAFRVNNQADSETMIVANADGAVELYHDNSKKFETLTNGIKVHGNIFTEDAGTYLKSNQLAFYPASDSYIDHYITGRDINFRTSNSSALDTIAMVLRSDGSTTHPDNIKSKWGTGDDLQIYHSSDNNSYIEESGSGSLVVKANDFYLQDAGANHTQLLADSDADVKLSFNGTAKLQTTTDGAKVMGTGNFVLPSGTTAQRGSASTGAVRWNTTLGQLEVYNGTEWAGVGASSPQIYKVTNTTTNGAAGTSMVITGEDFVSGATVHYMGGNGTSVAAGSVAFNSSTQLTAVSPALLVAGAPYSIKVTNPDGGEAVAAPEIEVSAGNAPSWTTASGQLGSNQIKDVAVSGLTVAASDADGQAITYSETTSVLTSNANTPAATMNLSLNSSTGAITGTAPSVTSDTTYNFTLRATDTAGNTADRAFNIVVLAAPAAIKWFAGTGYGATGTRSGTTWSHTGYNPNASGGGNANNNRLRVYGNGTGGTYAGFHHFLYSNAITIPTGHDRCDIYISSIYTNNNGYRYNQGNTWTTSQPSGNSHGSGAFGARNMGSHGSGLQQYDVPSNHQGVTRYFQMFVFGGQNGVQYQEITLIKTYNQNNP